jgi:dephospho-CoA kinase
VPLLAESSHWRDRVERVLVVDCREATQLARVVQRPGWTPQAASAVIAQQASRVSRRACADAVIYNDGLSLAQLALEVDAICRTWVPVR